MTIAIRSCAAILAVFLIGVSHAVAQGGQNFGMKDMEAQMTKLKKVRILFNTVHFDNNSHIVHFDGFVRLFGDNGTQIFADKAVANLKTEDIVLTGRVQVYQASMLYHGNRVEFNYGTNRVDTRGMKISVDPFLLEANHFRTVKDKGRTIYIGRNAGVTTHDVKDPNFWVKAKKITIYPDNKITFNHLKLYAGKTPIFWLPYFSQPLNQELGYHFLPGNRSNWGPFLMNRYGVMIGGDLNPVTEQKDDAWLLAQWLLDFRTHRGIGTGVDLFDTRLRENENLGWLKLYYTNDLDPSRPRSGFVRGPVNEDRYRVEFKNRFDNSSVAGLGVYTDVNITWLSDRYYLEDFEPRTYIYNPEPDSTLGIFRRREYTHAGVYARFRLNDFQQTDSRLPEAYYEQVKRPIFKSNVLHQGSTSIGLYRENLADFNRNSLTNELTTLPVGDPRIAEINALIAKRDFIRFHTYHELSQSFRPFNGVTVTPKAGMGFTQYWQEGVKQRQRSRRNFHVGLDTSFKFSKIYNTQNKRWGIDDLKHVTQPYINLSVVSTNELDSSFTRIDRLTPTTRPRSIDVGSFTAIDDINNWSIARFGVRNELLTRRDEGSHQWLTMDTYIDYFFQDPELNRNYSNLYNDLQWQPLPWMAFNLETQFPIVGTGSGFTEVATGVRFMPSDNWEISVNYRFLDNHPALTDSSRIDVRAYTRINEKWGFDIYQQYEMDDNTLEVQQYTLHRDFDSWVASLGVLHRDNRNRNEFSVLLSFTLKEFPSINLPLTIDQKDN